MTKNRFNIFHGAIIALFILSFNGCGYKDNPTYVKDDNKTQNLNK